MVGNGRWGVDREDECLETLRRVSHLLRLDDVHPILAVGSHRMPKGHVRRPMLMPNSAFNGMFNTHFHVAEACSEVHLKYLESRSAVCSTACSIAWLRCMFHDMPTGMLRSNGVQHTLMALRHRWVSVPIAKAWDFGWLIVLRSCIADAFDCVFSEVLNMFLDMSQHVVRHVSTSV